MCLKLFVFQLICSSPEGPHPNHMVYKLYDADMISNALLRADFLTTVSLSFLVCLFFFYLTPNAINLCI